MSGAEGAGQDGSKHPGGTLVLVLGMGRSGTSALTRVLGLCGAGLPLTPLPAIEGSNDRGFWEPAPIVRAHDRILEQLGTAWDGPMPAGAWETERWAGELANLTREQFGSSPVIAVKDPRASRLVAIWERVGALLQRRVVCVIALRHPAEVAASLSKRDAFPREKSLRIWREYMLESERATRSMPRVVVSYDALLADWRRQVGRVNEGLGLGLDIAAGTGPVTAFLDGGLRHHRADDGLADDGLALDGTTEAVLGELEKMSRDEAHDERTLDGAHGAMVRESAALRARTLRRVAPDSGMGFTGERFVPGLIGEIETEHVSRYVFASALCAGKRVLDIACGEGYGSAMLAQVASDVVGVDIDEASVAHAAASYGREGLRFEVGSCEKIPAKKGSFDVVVSFETIEHIEDHAAFLREVRRVLRPGGVFVCSTPDRSVYRVGQEKNPFHKKEMTAAEFEELLSKRFGSTAFYGQRLVTGSMISRSGRGKTELVRTPDGRVYERGPAAEGATYLLAVCSDGKMSWPNDQVLNDARFTIGSAMKLREDRARLEKELTEASARMKEASARAAESDRTAERLRADCDRLRASGEQAGEERSRLAEDRGRLLAERAAAEAERDAAIRDAASAQVDYQRARAELDRVREEMMEAREKAAAAQASLAATRSESETLRRATAEAIRGRDGALEAQKAAEIHAARVEERARRDERASAERTANELAARDRERARADAANADAAAHAEQSRQLRDELAWMRATRSWRWTRVMRVATAAGRAAGVRGLGLGVRIGRSLGVRGTQRLVIARRAMMFRGSRLFDAGYYLRENPDVGASGVDPAWHFAARGGAERRRPSLAFDTGWYLDSNPDVAASGVHPFEHFITRGVIEGRSPRPALTTPAHPATTPANASGPAAAVPGGMDAGAIAPGAGPSGVVSVTGVCDSGPVPEVVVDPERLAGTKVLAFYLPQFHPIPENDAWWGKGFTEWRNVTRARPMFAGHQQPVLPGELGYYDLRVPEVRERQAELARSAGIHGFCYHHYWFNGRRLLEGPLDAVVASGQPDFPFCVCWANENWTRRWDGQAQHVLMRQQHSLSEDRRFILDLIPYLEDDRYVRVSGRPVVVVYRANLMENAADTAAVWRDECHRAGLGEVHLCAVMVDTSDPRPLGFDAAVEFPLHHFPAPEITRRVAGLDPGFTGVIQDYPAGARELINNPRRPDYRLYRGVMPSWDNTARRMEKGSTVYHGATPEMYEAWLKSAINQRHADEGQPGTVRENLVFINAWNEWAEGAVLEPRLDNGDAYLRATARALGGPLAVQTEGQDDHSVSGDWADPGSRGEALGAAIETKIKRVVRSNPAINSFVNRYPGLKTRAAGLVRRVGQGAETEHPGAARDTDGRSNHELRPVKVRWHGKPAMAGSPKLLVVSHDAYQAGAQLILLENLKHWVQSDGFDCRVVLLGSGPLEGEFVRMCPTTCIEGSGCTDRRAFTEAVLDHLDTKGWTPDASFCNSAASADAMDAVASRKIPLLSAVYELPTSIENELGGYKTINRVARNSKIMMVASEFVRQRLHEAYQIPLDRMVASHTGVLARPWPERDTARRSIRAELGVGMDAAIVLGCGSIHHRKGTDLFVHAAAQARAAGLDRETVFVWVGGDQRGPVFRNWCKHDMDRLGVADMVRFVFQQADPAAWFAGSDVFAMTSREDPFPMVNLEAICVGLGIVAFDGGGGAPEALLGTDGADRGIVVPYMDTGAMGAAIAGLINEPARLNLYRERCLAFAETHLGWERYMAEIRTLLGRCSDSFAHARAESV